MESIVRPTAQCQGPWRVTGGSLSPSSCSLSLCISISVVSLSLSLSLPLSPCFCLSLSLSLSLQGTVKSLLSTPVPQLFSKPQHLPSAPHSSAGRWVQPAQCPSKPPSPPPATQCPFTQGLHSALCCISNSWREKLPGCLRPGISLGCGHMDRAF